MVFDWRRVGFSLNVLSFQAALAFGYRERRLLLEFLSLSAPLGISGLLTFFSPNLGQMSQKENPGNSPLYCSSEYSYACFIYNIQGFQLNQQERQGKVHLLHLPGSRSYFFYLLKQKKSNLLPPSSHSTQFLFSLPPFRTKLFESICLYIFSPVLSSYSLLNLFQ